MLRCSSKLNPDEIKATKISSRLNNGNKDLTGQVGQAGQADTHGLTQTLFFLTADSANYMGN